ncbi:hypothetical protein [Variovorax sp. YR266]|uniref:hypothetical protein n=1 Tax=Variovorax sp. YR266 TaxID=1884386 RepID=UPI001160014E|nr:hypothetical protein [Variovorax sp. YR266]
MGIGRISAIAVVCASSVFLGACVQGPEIVGRTPAERQAGWARKLEVTNDTFKGLTTFKGAYVARSGSTARTCGHSGDQASAT